MKKIAVDAMGGDYAPQAIVEGVNQALADFSDIEIQLYGDESKIKQYLTATERVSIIHTDEKIDFETLETISLKPEIKQELRQFMDQLYEEYVGIHLTSKKFIDSLADWGQLLKEEDK